jgi:hypothetical protein
MTVYAVGGRITTGAGFSAEVLQISIGDKETVKYEVGWWDKPGEWKTVWLPSSQVSGDRTPRQTIGFVQG